MSAPSFRLAQPGRAGVESALGCDLSGVRLHADATSDALIRAVGSSAFSIREHVFLQRRDRDTGRIDLRHKLDHELVHVAQHRRDSAPLLQRSPPESPTPLPSPEDLEVLPHAVIKEHPLYIDNNIQSVTFRIGESFTVHYTDGGTLTRPLDDSVEIVKDPGQKPNLVRFGSAPAPAPEPAAADPEVLGYEIQGGRIVPWPIDSTTAPILTMTLTDAYRRYDRRTETMAKDGAATMESMAWFTPAPVRALAPILGRNVGRRLGSAVPKAGPQAVAAGGARSAAGDYFFGPKKIPTQEQVEAELAKVWARIGGKGKMPTIVVGPTQQHYIGQFESWVGEVGRIVVGETAKSSGTIRNIVAHEAFHARLRQLLPFMREVGSTHPNLRIALRHFDEWFAYFYGGYYRFRTSRGIVERLNSLVEMLLSGQLAHQSAQNFKEAIPGIVRDAAIVTLYIRMLFEAMDKSDKKDAGPPAPPAR